MKTWFITGCAEGGLGYCIAEAALEAGDCVVATSRHPEQVAALVKRYEERVLPLQLDVTSADGVRQAVAQAVERFGSLDVLVNNAGYAYRAAVEEGEEEKIRQIYEINLFAPLHLMRVVLPIMREQQSGTIVNITSIAAVSAAVGSAFYASTKAALELLSDGLRKEAEPLGIRVMIVEPGALRTHFRRNLQESPIRLNAYEKTAWQTRPEIVRQQAPEQGNPRKAGRLIVRVVNQKRLPMRLQVGSDSVAYVRARYAERLSEVDQYEALSHQTDF